MLSDLPIYTGRKGSKTIGFCSFEGNRRTKEIKVTKITLLDYNYESRFYMEQVLLHEMCHVYQIQILCGNNLDVYKRDSRQGSGSSGHGPLFFKAADLVNNSPKNTEGFKITQYEEGGHIVTKISKNMKLDGWFKCAPIPPLITFGCLANTYNGKQYFIDSDPRTIFTYANVETKKRLQDGFGRKQTMFTYGNRAVQDVIKFIQNGDLVPIVKTPNKPVSLFVGKNKETGKYEFVSSTKSNIKSFSYDDVEDVKMNAPYSILKDRMLEFKLELFKGSYFNLIKEAIKLGVYSFPKELEHYITESGNLNRKDSIKLESDLDIESDIEKDLDVLEDINNVLSIEEYSDGSFKVSIC